MNTSFSHLTKKLVVCLFSLLLVLGCSDKQRLQKHNDTTSLAKSKENNAIDWASEFEVKKPKRERKTERSNSPRFKDLSPLATERISMSFVEISAPQVLQALAHAVSLNLILSSSFNSAQTITAEFQEMKVQDVLDSVCKMLDVVWSEQNGNIYVEPQTRKIIHLDFLGSIQQSSYEVGGDVLGNSAGGSTNEDIGSSPLSGRFNIEGEMNESVTDIYTNITETVETIVGSEGSFSLNRQTGTLMVRSKPSIVGDVESYIGILRDKYRRQVLIEAKIIEVNLSEKHQLGIDWRSVGGLISSERLRSARTVTTIDPNVTQTDSFYTLNIDSKYSNITGIFKALEEFGSLSILSNPRLSAMNGQSALISVGQSVAYLRSFSETVEGTGDDRTIEFETEIGSVFDGVLLGVTPVIESDHMVSLHVVPIKSDLVDLETIEFGSVFSPFQLTLPKVNLREMSTVSRVKSGDIVLLGGLIMDFNDKGENNVPILSDIPMLGRLFKLETSEKRKVEMIVALQVHIITDETDI